MVLRIHNVGKWACVEPGNSVVLAGLQARKIRVEVNCPADARFDVIDQNGEVTFLAVVKGHEVMEFVGETPTVTLAVTSEDEVYYFTNDGDNVTFESFEASFTKIVGRKARNPELERIMFKMEQNMSRRLSQQAVEFQLYQERREAAQAAAAAEAEAMANEANNGAGDGASGASGDNGAATGASEQSGDKGAAGGA